LQAAIKTEHLDELRWPDFSQDRPQLEKFYRAGRYSLAWVQGSELTPSARDLIEVLLESGTEGLIPEDYDAPLWSARVLHLEAAHTPEEEVRFDLALTVCAMRYISDLSIGRINPNRRQFGVDIDHKQLDLADYLSYIHSSTTNLKSELARIEPPFAGYQLMRRALLKYTMLAKQPDTEQLPPPVGIVYRGGYYTHFGSLAQRLRQLGDLPAGAIVPENMIFYDGPLRQAVQRFQQRHALTPTGDLTTDTIERLNVPLRNRVEQMRLAMERYRWLNPGYKQPAVVINLPEFALKAYDESGRNVLSIGVNVGDAYDFQTPVFENSIQYVVFRPYWYVTPRILRDEIIPEVAKDRGYIRDNKMEVITQDGRVITSGLITDDILNQMRAGSLTVRQRPGPNNAVGLVKFVFPNDHRVFLHDTPQGAEMFTSEERAGSHGCIHLEHPAELAQWLLRNQPGWTMQRIQHAMKDGRDNVTVKLTHPVTIGIAYETAIAYPNGDVHFYSDIYGHDAFLEKALAAGYSSPRQRQDFSKLGSIGSL
jgi:murein L,D-transpeptidase YcbB/YkuD